MENKKQTDFSTDWYTLWMEQSKQFFRTAEENLQGLFAKNVFVNPEEHMQQIKAWLDALKQNWQFMELNEQQRAYQDYWQSMLKMCNDANNMLIKQWIKRSHEKNPIKNIQELYALWLSCCNEAYKNMLKNTSFQSAYGDYINATIKFWKSALNK